MHRIVARELLEVIAIISTVPVLASSGIENVLVMTDVYSKFTIALPTRNQTAQTVAKTLAWEWFFRYGVPCQIHMDQGWCFDAKIVTKLYKIYAIQKSRAIQWETDNARDIAEQCMHCFVDTLSEIQVAKAFARSNICLQCNTSCQTRFYSLPYV